MCCETLVIRVKERMGAGIDGEYGAEKCVGAEGRVGILHNDRVQD